MIEIVILQAIVLCVQVIAFVVMCIRYYNGHYNDTVTRWSSYLAMGLGPVSIALLLLNLIIQ